MKRTTLWILLCLTLAHASSVYAQTDVIMQHNTIERTGWNDKETILSPSNVHAGSFGKLFEVKVDDKIYAQQLVVRNVATVAQGLRNVVYVATVNNTIYAFDADSGSAIWSHNYTPNGRRPPRSTDIHAGLCGTYNDFSSGDTSLDGGHTFVPIVSNIGIVGTPVIDIASQRMYFVSRDVDPNNADNGSHSDQRDYSSSGYIMRLHAIDIRDGNDVLTPVVITAQVNGVGDGSVGGKVSLDPRRNNQRGGLLLSHGIVYITFASHCDWQNYHGWILGYNASNLTQQIVYCSTPDKGEGGIWMSGSAPAVDGLGNIYVTSGNSTGGIPTSIGDRGESVIKLTPNALDNTATSLAITDYFTPDSATFNTLNQGDLDLPIQVLLVPGTNLAISGCKDGNLYVMSTVKDPITHIGLGGFARGGDQDSLSQKISQGVNAQMHSSFAYFGGDAGRFFYSYPEKTQLLAYPIVHTGSKDTLNNLGKVIGPFGPSGAAGGFMSVSSNGTSSATGIVWVSHAVNSCNANQELCGGLLRAFLASDIRQELWNSSFSPADKLDSFAKTDCPTIANGKVYIGSNGKQSKLMVYGLTSSSDPCPGKKNVALTANNSKATYYSFTNFGFNNSAAPPAFDNNTGTGWHSSADDVTPGNPSFLLVDLGDPYDICSVNIFWGNSLTTKFAIDGSNTFDPATFNPFVAGSGGFTTLVTVSDNDKPGYTLLLQNQSYRYIRVRPISRVDNSQDHIINELQVVGVKSNPCPTPTNLSIGSITKNTAVVSWTAAAGAQKYHIKYRVGSVVADYRTLVVNAPTTTATLQALTCGAGYEVIVETECTGGGLSNDATINFSTGNCTFENCGNLTRYGKADVGEVGVAGYYCYADNPLGGINSKFDVHGSGTGIDGTSDGFQTAYKNLAGDVAISARIVGFGASDAATSKAGIMMREGIDYTFGARFAFIGFTKTQIVFEYRNATNATTVQAFSMPISPSTFIKLSKVGTVYSAYTSPTGAANSWIQRGSSIDLGFGAASVDLGPVTTSGDNVTLSTGTLDFYTESSPGPLPITLLNFYANNVNNEYVAVQWSTAMEENNDRFEIERSSDGADFQKIATVKAVGNSNVVQHYSIQDLNPLTGLSFYRLKQVDNDGKIGYSEAVPVRFGTTAGPTIFPNPTTNLFTVVAGEEPVKSVELYSTGGARIHLYRNDAGSSSIKIPSADLPAGIYIVEIRTSNNVYRQKLIKQ